MYNQPENTMSREKSIGRQKERRFFQDILESQKPEFVAVYGRRRVGKTHLVRQCFSSKGFFFEFSGMRDTKLNQQLANFKERFDEKFPNSKGLPSPTSWREALSMLTHEIERIGPSDKITLFFDELPWIATSKSGFVQALDYYWNGYWSKRAQIKLIVCGSAASWMIEHLINTKGGLHNRVTRTLLLNPLSLGETEELLRSQGWALSRLAILDLYLMLGGIPHYLLLLNSRLSVAQNIDQLCFQKGGLLRNEFSRVFHSLFNHAEDHELIIREIAKKRYGISRRALLENKNLKKGGLRSGGTFNKRLEELEAASFIRSFVPFKGDKRQRFFVVSDEYVSFFLRWVEGTASTVGSYWSQKSKSPEFRTWLGYNFEQTCFKHLETIKQALSLVEVPCHATSWEWRPKKGSNSDGAQIDLLLDREDGAITICEIKCSQNPFTIDKSYARQLLRKMQVFEERAPTDKQLLLVLITTKGVKENSWSKDLVDGEVILDDLFR